MRTFESKKFTGEPIIVMQKKEIQWQTLFNDVIINLLLTRGNY